MTDQSFVFNGINGSRGTYLTPSLRAEEVSRLAQGELLDPAHLAELKGRNRRETEMTFGTIAGVDPKDLASAGWGVIFPHDLDPAIRDALRELFDHRKAQASRDRPGRYKEYAGFEGYRPGESKRAFLARHGAAAGMPADPDKVPYYLLLVADPSAITYQFQYQLDVEYAVGRLWFERPDGPPDLDAFARYARSLVTVETGKAPPLPRKAVLFGVRNPKDQATSMSADFLVRPLAEKFAEDRKDWEWTSRVQDRARKADLVPFMGGAETPALLFTASHGMGFDHGDPRQFPHQGALLCQDWPGPEQWGDRPIPPDHYLSADDVPDSARLLGLVAFHFACYGLGTPRLDDFPHLKGLAEREVIAPRPFVARLPQRLLGHPHGGALAVVGHVERAWSCSFHGGPKLGSQLQAFQSTLAELLDGTPVGCALEYFNQLYAALSTELSGELEDIKFGKIADDLALSTAWTANNDARSYLIFGDPAARLVVGGEGASPSPRPAIDLVSRPIPPTTSGEAREDGEAVGGASAGGSANAGASRQPAPTPDTATDFSPPSTPLDDAFWAQVARAERRYLEREAARENVSFAPGVSSLMRVNDPERVRRRLRRLGMPPGRVEQVVGGATSFAPVSGESDERSGPEVALERILGKNDLIDVRFLEAGARAARSIGRIKIRTAGGRALGFGTGSLVGPRLLLTNHHVLRDEPAAAASLVEFHVQDGIDGLPMTPSAFLLAPGEFFLTSPELDFTLVAVRPRGESGDELGPLGWSAPSLQDDDPVLVEEFVNIVQHPGGRPKQVALRDNQVIDLLPDFLHYRADTEPGSSGSPVFNDQWELVGLHHSGVPRRDEQGRILAAGGGPWSPEMGERRVDWVANEGVRLSRILRFVKEQDLGGDTPKRLRDGLFSGPPAGTTDPVSSPSQTRVPPESLPSPSTTSSVAPGTITLSVPLQITFRLDQPPEVVTTPPAPAVTSPVVGPPAPSPLEEAVSIDPDYDNREGYDPEFLGAGPLRVGMPRLSPTQERDAARARGAGAGGGPFELKYHHYSVVMNRRRRLAFFTAVNIDGRTAKAVERERDKWFFDPRIPRDEQVGNDLYAGTAFDRGHLVRRLDPTWGRTKRLAKVANDDTFHFTNCGPQHERFNQGKNLWAGLEDFLLRRAVDDRKRLVVFTGPVFRDDDPKVRGVPIPRDFWKVAVVARPNGRLAALGFVVSQDSLLGDLAEASAVDVARTYQVSVERVEELTGLDFGPLRGSDTGGVDGFGREADGRRELETFDDVALPDDGEDGPGALAFAAPAAATQAGPTDVVPGTGLGYYLLAFDANGRERADHPRGMVSRLVAEALAGEPVTDVFLFSHGWQGDVPGARRQYHDWVRAMADRHSDRDRIARARPGFRGLLVGIHWPSLPWGDEDLGRVAFAPGADPAASLVEDYARRLGDTPEVRAHLRTIALATTTPGTPDRLPPEVSEAYRELDRCLGLGSEGVAGPPGADREPFDPDGVYSEALTLPELNEDEGVSFGSTGAGNALLSPLRTLSFWTMKDRARQVGEGSVHPLLVRLQESTAGRDVRFHLVGHSFGGIVATAAVVGPPGASPLPRPVDSLSLLQGALSLWSYSGDIPHAGGRAGYFHRLFAEGRVRGPVITTQSRYDRAVGTWYPLAARTAGQVAFAVGLPKYGGVGTFGIQGRDLGPADVAMGPETASYDFRPGRPYNLEASRYINRGGGSSGAHSDIARPEVAHAVWSAVAGTGPG